MRTRIHLRASMVIGLAACGDNLPAPASPPQPWTSGQRLQVATYVTDDGFVGFRGVYDRDLDLTCAIDPSSAGSCPTLGYLTYTDPACTTPVIQSQTLGPLERFASSHGVVYDVGALYYGDTFNFDPTHACAPTPNYEHGYLAPIGDPGHPAVSLRSPRHLTRVRVRRELHPGAGNGVRVRRDPAGGAASARARGLPGWVSGPGSCRMIRPATLRSRRRHGPA